MAHLVCKHKRRSCVVIDPSTTGIVVVHRNDGTTCDSNTLKIRKIPYTLQQVLAFTDHPYDKR